VSEHRESTGTSTSNFGVGRRQNHDASKFYSRFSAPTLSDDDEIIVAPEFDDPCILGDARNMAAIPDNSVALVVTSPPYFAGKAYEEDLSAEGVPASYREYLQMLEDVFADCVRTLEPGGRIAVNVANLGRKPYRSLSADVIHILQDRLHLLLRGEVVWKKAEGAAGSVAWGSYRSAANPVLRDLTERVIIASKGRFDRAIPAKQRKTQKLPHDTKITADEFMAATLDVWDIAAESARRVNHPAPFPVALPQRLVNLYTYEGDLVLDPFMGSGTTLVAALKEGRRAVGYYLDLDYVETARKRVARIREELQSDRMHSTRLIPYIETAAPPRPEPDAVESDDIAAFQRRATLEGKAAQDQARAIIEKAGFEIVKRNYRVKGTGAQFNLYVSDQAGGTWLVDVSGAFTTTRGGLRRTDTVWKALGRAHVLSRQETSEDNPIPRLLLLTSDLPNPGSEGDVALHASVGTIWDVIQMYEPAGMARLAAYADGDLARPLPGFWTEQEVDGLS
jgi:site-specific DNA-methyltransferase (adenine-specific)